MFRSLIFVLFSISYSIANAQGIAISKKFGGLYELDVETGETVERYETPEFFDVSVSASGNFYGITGFSGLYRTRPNSMQLVRIGAVGVFINALAFDENDRLFGAGNNILYQIDKDTAEPSLLMSVDGFDSSGDIAFLGSQLYATSLHTDQTDILYVFDLKARKSRAIGEIGFRHVYGLVAQNGELFGLTEQNEMISIDTQTGRGSLLGKYNLPGFSYGATGIREPALN
ncbi:MAG: hypothetical protein AAF713_01415 [Pseudomonadota bacterium]